jgi:quercetin dioxygenase-like cupin family protein
MFNTIRNRLFVAALLGVAPLAFAHGPGQANNDGQEKVTVFQQQKLADVPGKQVLFFTVEYAPGQQSIPHVHGGSVIAYVLEGSVISQLDGQAPVTYRAGESWYETPRISHLVSKNASATHPAKLLVWILDNEGAPVLTPLPRPKK